MKLVRRQFLVMAAGVASIPITPGGLWAQSGAPRTVSVLMSGAFRSPMAAIAPMFVKASGHKLSLADDTSPRIAQRVGAGEAVDVAILSAGGVDGLIKDGKMLPDSKMAVARAGFGVVVRKGARRPDISTVDAFKKALLDAKSVAYTDPATGGQSGVYFAKVLGQLGIAEDIKKKAKHGNSIEAIAVVVGRGEAEIGIHPIPAIVAHADVADLVGQMPGPLQSYNRLAAGIPSASREPAAARELLKFLATPAVQALMKSKGLDPG